MRVKVGRQGKEKEQMKKKEFMAQGKSFIFAVCLTSRLLFLSKKFKHTYLQVTRYLMPGR